MDMMRRSGSRRLRPNRLAVLLFLPVRIWYLPKLLAVSKPVTLNDDAQDAENAVPTSDSRPFIPKVLISQKQQTQIIMTKRTSLRFPHRLWALRSGSVLADSL
jgi:hypothetical protein